MGACSPGHRPDGRHRADARGPGAALGPSRVRGSGRAGRAATATRRRHRGDAAAYHDRCGDRADRGRDCLLPARGVPVSWDRWALAERAAITAAGRWRTIRELDSSGPVVQADGGEIVSFASNHYFRLSPHPAVRAAAHEAIERWGAGAGSARLIAGSRPVHSELERELAEWEGAERALLF